VENSGYRRKVLVCRQTIPLENAEQLAASLVFAAESLYACHPPARPSLVAGPSQRRGTGFAQSEGSKVTQLARVRLAPGTTARQTDQGLIPNLMIQKPARLLQIGP